MFRCSRFASDRFESDLCIHSVSHVRRGQRRNALRCRVKRIDYGANERFFPLV